MIEKNNTMKLNSIKTLLHYQLIEMDMPEVSSVDIDPIYDNHEVQFTIVKKMDYIRSWSAS